MTGHQDNEVFLAATAIEEFWDTSRPVVFLGPWCKKFSRKNFMSTFKNETVSSPLQDQNKLYEAYRYTAKVFDKLMPQVANAMNIIHKSKHNERYWKIIVGPWLFHYIDILYDRSTALKTFLDQKRLFTTIKLSERSFITPESGFEFLSLAREDAYNLQLFSRILDHLFPNKFEAKELAVRHIKPAVKQKWTVLLKGRVNKAISDLILNLRAKNGNIAMKSPYFPDKDLIKILQKTGATLLEDINPDLNPTKTDPKIRDGFVFCDDKDDDFISMITHLIKTDIPKCYIEGYLNICSAGGKYPAAKAVLSANSWYFDEPFKVWAAQRAEEGAFLVGLQHGGNYGSDLFIRFEDYEKSIVDRYYTWGWVNRDDRKNIVPFYANKLIDNRMLEANNTLKGVLLVSTGTPRYLYRMNVINSYHSAHYLDLQLRFAAALGKDLRGALTVRLYQEDLGAEDDLRWRERFSDVKLERAQIPYWESVKTSRLIICDHLSTTFLEALSAGKPTVLFWDPDVQLIRPEVKEYYEGLRKAGVLFDDPEAAAQTVKNIYYDVESWWNEDKRQKIIMRFCEKFALKSKDPVNEWTKELVKICSN